MPRGSSSRSRLPQKDTRRRVPNLPPLHGPLHDLSYIEHTHAIPGVSIDSPKYTISNARYETDLKTQQGFLGGHPVYRSTVTVRVDPPIIAVGDDPDKKHSQELAFRSAAYQLHENGFLFSDDVKSTLLSDGITSLDSEEAKNFMDYYCRRFKFSPPEINAQVVPGGWEAIMLVNGRRIGLGNGVTKKGAITQSYLDVVQYIEKCDPALWTEYTKLSKKGGLPGYVPDLYYTAGNALSADIRDLCVDIKNSTLHRNRPTIDSSSSPQSSTPTAPRSSYAPSPRFIRTKSEQLSKRRTDYLSSPTLEKIRTTRSELPVSTRVKEVTACIEENDVTILMAATGSGKTTQLPQIILDDWIDKGVGAKCNILCTQPRRLAALSVADRVAKERGESLGNSVGYQVRFEQKLPEDHGSITFCTTGVFLKKLQSELADDGDRRGSLDDVTHIVVDEVHERDVDTDLVLVVLKRLLRIRKEQNKPIKVILMSATIDPTLFREYFRKENGEPAEVLEIPGRSFPVQKHFLDDFVQDLAKGPLRWVFRDETVAKYIATELGPAAMASLPAPKMQPNTPASTRPEDIEIPYLMIAATISYVLQKSDSGHVLVFLPGWDDITSVQKILLAPSGPLGIDFTDRSKYHMHLLHSTIPLAEQQIIFDPPPPGVRRIILATNIAETSVTIPDVVYVVDSARLKEQRYDPEKHIMSLVSAWVGSSNLNQRAGRAGRHRPGDYYGVLGRARAIHLEPYQTVEMNRVDLTNVVMHVKALNFPGMAVEDVLAASIEPPASDRVAAAMGDLKMVGALDEAKNLTPLGRVLLQLPVDVAVGRLVLYGSFFRCLDQALTLAAILTNRDPFVTPMHLKAEASAARLRWVPPNFKSDALSVLMAYNAWEELMKAGSRAEANQFCVDNFLARPTLLMIQKIKGHLLQALFRAGVIQVSGGGVMEGHTSERQFSRTSIPAELNENGRSLPLLAALISLASQPNFAIRVGERVFRTKQDKVTMVHPSSVNHRKFETSLTEDDKVVKQVISYSEKRRNVSVATNGTPMTFLVNTTRVDPLIYLLFGAHQVELIPRGLKCDEWITIVGHLDGLEDLSQLKSLLDGAMQRVYEGIIMSSKTNRRQQPREEAAEWDDDDDSRGRALSKPEVKELDFLSRDLVRILEAYSEERNASTSRAVSRPSTPSSFSNLRTTASTHVTPYGSRASTPLGRMRRW